MSEKKIAKDQIRFFAGYSGWGIEQLNDEIRDEGWLINNSSIELCMNYSTQKLWSDLIKTEKEEYAIWANIPKDPSLN